MLQEMIAHQYDARFYNPQVFKMSEQEQERLAIQASLHRTASQRRNRYHSIHPFFQYM